MASSNKKIIVVVGATGNQGSSVTQTFLKDSNWHVRALTRNPSSAAAQALHSLGAEVIKADLSDLSSLDIAFKDANVIFLNTTFWETYGPLTSQEHGGEKRKIAFDTEVSYGKNAAIAAAKVPSLERLVYSALPPANKHSKGKYSPSHMDSKAAIVEYIGNHLDLVKKASFIYLGAYNTNKLNFPTLDPASGKYTFVLSVKYETRWPIIDPKTSTGPLVHALILEPAGTNLLAYDTNSYLSVGEIKDLWSRVSGKEAIFVEVNIEAMHEKTGIPIEILDAPGFISEFGYLGGVGKYIEPGELKEKAVTKSFEVWLGEKLAADAEEEAGQK
jgi:hypothetical protein